MKMFSKIVATGKEWKPCIECGRIFEHGEILCSIATDTDVNVTYWYCSICTERYFSRPEWPGTPQYELQRLERFIEMEKFDEYGRYAKFDTLKYCSNN